MDISKLPQFQLYLFTLLMLRFRKRLIPANCDVRCVDSTIINRAYYSSYLFCQRWLLEVHGHELKSKKEFSKGTKFITEHSQVRRALKKYGQKSLSTILFKLAQLRNKADYYPYVKLTNDDLHDAIGYMESIFQGLNFD